MIKFENTEVLGWEKEIHILEQLLWQVNLELIEQQYLIQLMVRRGGMNNDKV